MLDVGTAVTKLNLLAGDQRSISWIALLLSLVPLPTVHILTLLNFQVYETPMRTMNSRLQFKLKVLFQVMGNFGCRHSKGT